jgi:hypothetical protein
MDFAKLGITALSGDGSEILGMEVIIVMREATNGGNSEFSNCRLFQESQDRRVHCDLSGEKTSCNGDILYCERSDTLRDYVLKNIEKNDILGLPGLRGDSQQMKRRIRRVISVTSIGFTLKVIF